jgi:hypothetical protein
MNDNAPNKNTIVTSQIDNLKEIFDIKGTAYRLTILGNITCSGFNDVFDNENKGRYVLRKMEYGNKVLMEQFQKTLGRDLDNYIVSVEFTKGTE